MLASVNSGESISRTSAAACEGRPCPAGLLSLALTGHLLHTFALRLARSPLRVGQRAQQPGIAAGGTRTGDFPTPESLPMHPCYHRSIPAPCRGMAAESRLLRSSPEAGAPHPKCGQSLSPTIGSLACSCQFKPCSMSDELERGPYFRRGMSLSERRPKPRQLSAARASRTLGRSPTRSRKASSGGHWPMSISTALLQPRTAKR